MGFLFSRQSAFAPKRPLTVCAPLSRFGFELGAGLAGAGDRASARRRRAVTSASLWHTVRTSSSSD
jgi:hypothetical protein